MESGRKINQVLLAIIEEYIETARPVGSVELTQKYEMPLSSATVRNYMAKLEEDGFLYQPHASAGRIPTESAYQYYLDNQSDEAEGLPKSIKRQIEKSFSEWTQSGLIADRELFLKTTAKMIASLSQDLVVMELGPNGLYYTGLTDLFKQPEFEHLRTALAAGWIIDHFEEMIDEIKSSELDGVEAFVGKLNHLECSFSAIMSRYELGNKEKSGIFGIIGPLRMPYGKNMALVRFIKDQLTTIF